MIGSGDTVFINHSISTSSIITVNGVLYVDSTGTLSGSKNIKINGTGVAIIYGTLTTSQDIILDGTLVNNGTVIADVLNNADQLGILLNNSGALIDVMGQLRIDGIFTNFEDVTTGDLYIRGTLTNHDTIITGALDLHGGTINGGGYIETCDITLRKRAITFYDLSNQTIDTSNCLFSSMLSDDGNGTIDFATVSFGVILLPVEFVEFELTLVDTKIIVHWVTASEFGNSHFEIERCCDGSNWQRIRRIDARESGNRHSVNEYRYVDTDPKSGINYYRIRQVKINGSFDYSQIRLIQVDDNKTEGIDVFPNPATNHITIQIQENTLLTGLKILDIHGRSCKLSMTSSSDDGLMINTTNLPGGIYFLRLFLENKNNVVKRVIILD